METVAFIQFAVCVIFVYMVIVNVCRGIWNGDMKVHETAHPEQNKWDLFNYKTLRT